MVYIISLFKIEFNTKCSTKRVFLVFQANQQVQVHCRHLLQRHNL